MRLSKKESPRELMSREMLLKYCPNLDGTTVINLDLTETEIDWVALSCKNTTWLGCRFPEGVSKKLQKKGALVFPKISGLPYNPYRSNLYTWNELLDGYDDKADNSKDFSIYSHFTSTRHNPPITEALAQRIHDHAIDMALTRLLETNGSSKNPRKVVGIMGGHSTPRISVWYRKTALLAHRLTKEGYFIASGGGPGIMEAANLGAWLSKYPVESIDTALGILEKSPTYLDNDYIQCGVNVLRLFPAGAENLAIPTWFYGHEPSNVFASHIAKYFSNSIREDTLLGISIYGVVYAPGSAGTLQEIFMDTAQNHYGTFGFSSPMCFLSTHRYEIETLIYPMLRQFAYGHKYFDLLKCSDEVDELIRFILQHPPVAFKS